MTNDFHTKCIAVEKGVLQDDLFPLLIFNIIINTFIQYVKEEKFTEFGYRTFKGFLPHNWFEFVEEAVAATSLEGENQFLLNLLGKWCRWLEMIVKASKCHLFGICKRGTTSTQHKPKLILDRALVPPVKLHDCFTYLDHRRGFKMSDDKHKSELIETINDQIEIIDKLPLHPKNKLKLCQHWKLLKVSWYLTVTKISSIWMKNNVNNTVLQYIQLWLEIPVNGTLNIVTQSKRKLGLGVVVIVLTFFLKTNNQITS